MTAKERVEFKRAIVKFERKLLKTKTASVKYLQEMGVLTPTGRLSKRFKKQTRKETLYIY